MFSGLVTLGSAIVSGISGYFKDKNEIKKVQVEADKLLIMAEAESKAKRLEREAEMDYDLDRIAMQNMDKTWKDELILIIWLVPVVLCFFPEYQIHVTNGFATLALVPDWYMYILVGMVVVIYGMRGMLKMALHSFGGKIKIKKNKDKDNEKESI